MITLFTEQCSMNILGSEIWKSLLEELLKIQLTPVVMITICLKRTKSRYREATFQMKISNYSLSQLHILNILGQEIWKPILEGIIRLYIAYPSCNVYYLSWTQYIGPETWKLLLDKIIKVSQNSSSLALQFWEGLCFEHIFTNDD